MGNGKLCCDGAATPYTYQQLKDALETGTPRKVKDGRPQVLVTIKSIDLTENLNSEVKLSKFQVQACPCTLEVSISGTNLQIVQELGSEAALKLMDKVGVVGASKRAGSEFMGQLPSDRSLKATSSTSLIEIKERKPECSEQRIGLGTGGWEKGEECKTLEVHVRVSLAKSPGDDQVSVTLGDMETHTVTGSTVGLRSLSLRGHVEEAVAETAGHAISQQVKARAMLS